MKDLIAKLHSDSADQILATFATLEMQLQGFAKSSYENELRIAELERQLQDHSAQAFSIGETYANALSRIAELEAQIAASADTDKLREAILALRVDPPRHYDNAQISAFCLGAKVMSEAAADVAASTALQAPVREVPGWISVEDRLPDSDPDKRVWATWTGAGNIELGPRQGEARFVASMGWQPIGHMGWDWNVSHWQPLPALPAAPVQPEDE